MVIKMVIVLTKEGSNLEKKHRFLVEKRGLKS